jgi:uncharacterized protein (DUF1501 family)
MANCCRDFTRSSMLHRAAAEAGRGLPAIEPGMPLPAGTGLDRRSLLLRSAGLSLAVYGMGALGPSLLDAGVERAAAARPGGRVLVSVFLPGGADSLAILFPAGDPLYRKLRPKLALPASAGQPFRDDERLRWHPAAASLATLHGEGKVTVLPAVGYAHADQSHFTSRHFWEVGATDAGLRTGWLGRYLDRVGTVDNPLQGLTLADRLQPSLASLRVPVAAVSSPDDYGFWAPGVWGDVEALMRDALGEFPGSSDPALRKAAGVASQSAALRRQLQVFAPKDDDEPAFTSPVNYPESDESFPKRLAGLAAMLTAGLPLRCVALEAPGDYDTHASQADELDRAVRLTADSLLAFQRDLEARGLAERVLTLVWSEFGRRAEENGSRGTDHGAAGAAFVVGARASGATVGEFPGLKHGLDDDGNLRATSDFRGLYAALLEQWLDHDADAVIPDVRRFRRPRVVR